MNEIAILQRLKIRSIGDDNPDEWENVAFTDSSVKIAEWINGAHRFEHRKVQWIKRQS